LNLSWNNNKYGEDKVLDACGLFGMMDTSGKRFSAKDPVKAMINMHDRGNGLGAGFAVYGIYPEYKQYYALHIMYMDKIAKANTEEFLNDNFNVIFEEEIPTREANVWNPPILWRYFVEPKKPTMSTISLDDYVVDQVMRINTETGKSFVFSSGKDMGVFVDLP
jgi:glutamate synthase domain-containing protein 1